MRTLTGTASSRENGTLYQQFVVPWFVRSGNQIEEWRYSSIWFDGLHPSQCHLYEAKGRYGFVFVDSTSYNREHTGFGRVIMQDMRKQFRDQYYVLTPHLYLTELHWVLHTFGVWLEMSEYINSFRGAPLATATHRPYPGWNQDD